MSAAPKAFPVSWDQFHRDCKALAWRLMGPGNDKPSWHAIVAITRGGLVPAAIIARELDTMEIAGRTEELVVFELIAIAGDTPEPPAWIAAYESGLTHFRAGRFSQAIDAFRTADTLRGGDPASVVMIERAQAVL